MTVLAIKKRAATERGETGNGRDALDDRRQVAAEE
jgi:hypothetical protein